MAAATRAPGHACDETCVGSPTAPSACTCRCRGANHGSQRATHGPATPAVAARRARSLDRLLTQAPADEDW